MFGNCVNSEMYISEEIILEILKRLPAKSLLRFMSVSKSWYSLIKSPNFISSHFNHQSSRGPRYLLYRHHLDEYYVHEDTETFDRHLEFAYPRMYYILGCYNGLVCFRKYLKNLFILWNPSLGKSLDIEVPHCTIGDKAKSILWFGFDEVSNDYKIVWVRYSTTTSWETRPLGVFIYSLNERNWRCVSSSFVLNDKYLIKCEGVYLNGAIHWVALRYCEEGDMPELILTFSLVDETFVAFHLPSEIVYVEPVYEEDDFVLEDHVDLVTVKRGSKNCLAVIHEDLTSLNLWVMEEEGTVDSWRKDFCVSHKDYIKKILHVRMNGEIVMQRECGGVVSLDRRLMRLKLLSSENLVYVGTYMESLALL